MSDLPTRTRLTGWGGTSPSYALVRDLPPDQVPAAVTAAGPRGLLARGLGRSYGDVAQNGGGLVLRVEPGPIALDEVAQTVTSSAGTSLHEVIRAVLPRGFYPMTTPGTRYVTLGGAVACDVHGKNHHRDGSFGDQVTAFDLVTADGTARTVTPDGDPALFWATVGGLGLTGVITSVTFRVRRVASAYVVVDTEKHGDLDSLMARMVELDATTTYSVAWLDLLAQGRSLGRSVLTSGEHARPEELGPRQRRDPLRLPERSRLTVPPVVPSGVVAPWNVRAFNQAWYAKARDGHRSVDHLAGFFHPLDGVGEWNRVYGPAGFLQYQFVVPDSAADVLREILARLVASRRASFLNVLKRFGPGNPAPLSFPTAGWTLAADLAVEPGVGAVLADLDELVLGAGGRIYLGKDARITPETFRRMYPRAAELAEVRRRTGAVGVFTSDLARRLRFDDLPDQTTPTRSQP